MVRCNAWSLGLGVLFGVVAWRVATFQLPDDLLASTRNILWNLKVTTFHAAQAAEHADAVAQALADPRKGIARTLRNVNTVTAQVGRTANVARLASSEQRAELRDLNAEALAVVKKLGVAVDATNERLNGDDGVLQEVSGVLEQLESNLVKLGAAADVLTGDGQKALQAAVADLESLGKLLQDPAFTEAAKSLKSAAEHTDGAAANGERALGYVADSLKPTKMSLGKVILINALSQVLGIPLRFLPQRVKVQ